ncbi:L,D-transpeptidase family protein [Zavarzinia compransoris]|uniref:L,D-transpeptidase family protein n=1 Tax=Zavarzinia marina TaxID=2911065 RepID=UPI001EEE26BB|nr:L,D-transpeptidase family protein [Zavarzinia marina]MCF4167466.1 L,D-transpeptidase family protein [Zavarzinia marina]
MRTAGFRIAATYGFGAALAAVVAAGPVLVTDVRAEDGPLILEVPHAEANAPAPAGPPTVATALPPPPPALPATAAVPEESDEPLTTGIDEEPAVAPPPATPVFVAPVPVTGPLDLPAVLGFDPSHAALAGIDRPALQRFYAQTGGARLWTGDGRLAALVPAVTGLIADAGAEGLDPARYPLGLIAALFAGQADGTAEVLLSDTLIRYVADRNGAGLATVRLPVDMRELGAPVDAASLAARALATPDPVAALAATGPQDPGYLALKSLLAEYRDLAAAGGWPVVAAEGAKISPGDYDSRLIAIRARLMLADGAGVTAGRADHYDPALIAAVKHFQLRHGLKDDGVIGRQTLAHLSATVEDRIAQILVNMERRRQLLPDLGPNRIIVNIPEFMLRYYEDGVLAMVTPVVVGRTKRKTPLLESRVTNIVLNPPWRVPARNAGEDIVRKQINDPTYLQSHGYTVYFGDEPVDPTTIDWTQVPRSRSIPYRLKQAPGNGNSLGRIKINFKNDYAVYLHDTPDKHLFRRDMRALSSGCVRVQDPFALGARLLRDVPRWDRERIDAFIARSTETVYVTVVHDIGVRLTYVTAWVDEQGQPQFREDLYGIDGRIARGLNRPVRLADAL